MTHETDNRTQLIELILKMDPKELVDLMRDVSRKARDRADEFMLDAKVHEAAARLIVSTDGAKTLGDVERLRGTPFTRLLAEESGIDHESVLRITSEPWTRDA